MADNPDKPTDLTAQERKKRLTDRLVKLGFLLVVLVGGLMVWLQQRQGPELPGWGGDLPEAIRQAKDSNRQIIVFFTSYPMNEDDKHAVENVVKNPDMAKAIKRFNYVTVHLDTEHNSAEAQKCGIQATPTYLLLDSSGKEIKRSSGRMNVGTFIDTFLGVSANG